MYISTEWIPTSIYVVVSEAPGQNARWCEVMLGYTLGGIGPCSNRLKERGVSKGDSKNNIKSSKNQTG